jgi:ABC-type dipeptide/oligopeptide/nickel transport system ATPase subunit
VLELNNIFMTFRQGIVNRSAKPVLDNVSVSVDRGETLGIMGDSGSGKTTLAKIAVRLINPDSGKVMLDGEDITKYTFRKMAPYRSRLQLVFQNPEGALNPEMTLGASMREAISKSAMRKMGVSQAVESMCGELGIKPELLTRYPNQVSGGEIQRVALSRALAFNPNYLFLDEPTSMLDASVQAHILSVLRDHQRKTDMGMVLITHDLDLIRCLCDRLAVIDKGKLIAYGKVGDVLGDNGCEYIRRYTSKWDALSTLTPYGED